MRCRQLGAAVLSYLSFPPYQGGGPVWIRRCAIQLSATMSRFCTSFRERACGSRNRPLFLELRRPFHGLRCSLRVVNPGLRFASPGAVPASPASRAPVRSIQGTKSVPARVCQGCMRGHVESACAGVLRVLPGTCRGCLRGCVVSADTGVARGACPGRWRSRLRSRGSP